MTPGPGETGLNIISLFHLWALKSPEITITSTWPREHVAPFIAPHCLQGRFVGNQFIPRSFAPLIYRSLQAHLQALSQLIGGGDGIVALALCLRMEFPGHGGGAMVSGSR